MTFSEAAINAALDSLDADTETPVSRAAIQRALEAAAPHMLADAWERCADGYCEQLANITLDWEELPNPYRSQA